MTLPEQDYEDGHSKNGELQILYLAVSGNLHAMFVLRYVGGRNVARSLASLQRENIRLLVTSKDPSLTARHITEAYHLPEGMVTVLDGDQCQAIEAAEARLLPVPPPGLCQLDRRLAGRRSGTECRDQRYYGAAGVGVLLGVHCGAADLCGQRGHAERGCCADVSGGMERSQHRRVRTQAA